MTKGRTVALIVAAGQGSRMGGPPKQFVSLGGKPVIAHSHATLAMHPAMDTVLVAIGAGQQAELQAALGPVSTIIGGATRRESVLNGLEALAAAKVPELAVPTVGDGEGYAGLLADKAAFEDFDADAYFNGHGFGFVRVQQLATEHLLGAR